MRARLRWIHPVPPTKKRRLERVAGAIFSRSTLAKRRDRGESLVSEIRLYFEGDGALRPGFKALLKEIDERARILHVGFNAVACNATPVDDFLIGVRKH